MAKELDFNEPCVVAMLVALLDCPAPERLDSLATVVKILVEDRLVRP